MSSQPQHPITSSSSFNNSGAGIFSANTGSGPQNNNNAGGTQNNNYNYNSVNYNEPNRNRCLDDLRWIHPTVEKRRIEQTKGGLLKDSYRWVLDHEHFQRWRDDNDTEFLWIKGDAGKGKTMLMCGIINELSAQMPAQTHTRIVSFFLCQNTDSRLNHASAVLRGLIFGLADQQPSLISHIQRRWDDTGRRLFDDANAFYTLSQILSDMLCDPHTQGCYLMIDALDECTTDLSQLLCFITEPRSASTNVKWIVSSRNNYDIVRQLCLDDPQTRLSLELNAEHVAQAIDTFIDYKVAKLFPLKRNEALRDEIRLEMRQKADGTFLWVALVAQELGKVSSWMAPIVVRQKLPGLLSLYREMLRRIETMEGEDSELCCVAIATATTAYRPLSLCELRVLSGLPTNVSDDLQSLMEQCASFITIRDEYVYLIHQSVKDFLTTEASPIIFRRGLETTHRAMFSTSIHFLNDALRPNMYNLRDWGISIDDVRQPEPDPLAAARYSCTHWVDHLIDAESCKTTPLDNHLGDIDAKMVQEFLQNRYLYWIEALSLLRDMQKGMIAITKLEMLLDVPTRRDLFNIVWDARRFILSHGWAIANAPLQAYASALIFSPRLSETRKQFGKHAPNWIVTTSAIESNWNACQATLEGHSEQVGSVAFSPDSKSIASGSLDGTIKIWDAITGHCKMTIADHDGEVKSIAFSPDSQYLAWESRTTLSIWNSSTGHSTRRLIDYDSKLRTVAFSLDSTLLASKSSVGIWDTRSGDRKWALPAVFHAAEALAFLPDGQRLASADIRGLRISNLRTGKVEASPYPGRNGFSDGNAFSADGRYYAFKQYDKVMVLDTTIYCCVREIGADLARLLVLSSDGQYLALALNRTVQIWDIKTGQCAATVASHLSPVHVAVAFSPNNRYLASSSLHGTVRVWDITRSGREKEVVEYNRGPFRSVNLSPCTRYIASVEEDETVKIWDAQTGCVKVTQESDGYLDLSTLFSPNGKILAVSRGGLVEIWDTAAGSCNVTLECDIYPIYSVTFSPDSRHLGSVDANGGIFIWDTVTGREIISLTEHFLSAPTLAFSPNGQLLASASDNRVKIWDTVMGDFKAMIDLTTASETISFDETGIYLRTDAVTFDLSDPTQPVAIAHVYGVLPPSYQQNRYGISKNGVWITHKGRNLLWLPSEYRTPIFSIVGSTVTLGCVDGRLLVFRFSGTVLVGDHACRGD
ncbi:Pfs, NACHT and WD domain protein [Ilyonectria destructans]|nr:Pfs, NACHT and WD domain protein [Ilyonectria destructans]